MHSKSSAAWRLIVVALLLLQTGGALFGQVAEAASSALADQPAEVLGLVSVAASAANAAQARPPALPSAGPYYQVVQQDALTGQLNTNVSGEVLTDTTWTLAGSPYIVTGAVTVVPTVTLTIEPGVTVQFQEGVTLLIKGRLLAEGTPQAGITFTGTTAGPGWWGGLSFEGTLAQPSTGSQLAYVTVSGGGRYSGQPGNLHLQFADVTVAHAHIANSLRSGLYARVHVNVHITDTAFINNGTTEDDYALWFTDGSVAPSLDALTLSGNSQDAIAFGGGTLTTRTWNALGYPYVLTGIQIIPYGETLTVEPGVVVISAGNDQTNITIEGRLEALGEPSAPITFTAMTAAPGEWSGLKFDGKPGELATGQLNYTTVEYGGDCGSCANLAANYAQVNVSHGIFRFSSRAGVLATENSAAGLVIENSQFISNTTHGIDNQDAFGNVLAANNWWGHASGPATPSNNCNPGGLGQAVSARVAFRPFLTSAGQAVNELAPADLATLSLNPLRYFAPADGTTRVWFEITLRDGAGLPIAGETVRLRTGLGTAVDGGTTDVTGRSFAYLTSNITGTANVFAELDGLATCEFARSATTAITFNTTADDPLVPDARSPYANDRVEFDPQPVVVGEPGTLRVRLHNPNPFAIVVDASFSYAQLGLGLTFGSVGQVNDFVIQPESDGVLEVDWVPLAAGHFCIKVDYTWTPVVETGLNSPSQIQANGSTQSNTSARPGPMLRPFDKNAIRKASVATTSLGDISFAAAGLDDIAAVGAPGASAPVGFLQGLMVGNILDFIFEGGGGIDCAMKGGTSCGGWKGPRMHVPGESMGNLASDPPSPDYETLVPLEILTFEPVTPSAQVPAARAQAVNELIRAGLDLTSYLTAAAVSYDRYAGAVEANELGYAAQQANAFTHYFRQSALLMDEVADKMDALVAELHAENLKFLLAEQDFIDYRQRLLNEGFNAQELEAARLVGKTDEGIALSLQRRLALDPADVSGWFDDRMTAAAQAFRELSLTLTFVPIFGSVGSPGMDVAGLGENSLVRVGDQTFDFQVGNPLDVPATINLQVRRINLPPDWVISLSTTSVTLDPHEQVTVTATASPGLAGVQGDLPRFAVEGYVGAELLGGVEFQVYLPVEQPFYGADRLFLPIIRKP